MIEIVCDQFYIATVSALLSTERDNTLKPSQIIEECHVSLQD